MTTTDLRDDTVTAEITIAPGESVQAAFDGGARIVRLAAGVHPGGVVLPTGARLLGAGAGVTVLVPGAPDAVAAPSTVPALHDAPDAVAHGIVAHRVADVVVQGLTVRGFSGAGVYAHTATGVRLVDVEADSDVVWGIYLRESTDLLVERCRAHGARYGGIALAFCHPARAEVLDCDTHANAYGVFVDNSSHTAVRRVRAHGNAAGVLLLHQIYPGEPDGAVTDCLVADCELTGNALAAGGDDPESLGAAGPPISGVGLAMIGAQRVTVVGNRITGNSPGGPTVMGAALVVGSSAEWGGSASDDNTIEWNTVRDNADDVAADPSGLRMRNNVIGHPEGSP